jgi:NAD(P) transhydrogenase
MLRTILSASSSVTSRRSQHIQQQLRALQGLVVGIPKESLDGECRVALDPKNIKKLKKAGAIIRIESNAGAASGFLDQHYIEAGADIVASDEAWKAEIVAKVRPPTMSEAQKIANRSIVSIIQPKVNEALVNQLVHQGATVFSMDSLLRTLSRGQAFDVLSSQANIAGIRAVTEAAFHLQRPFTSQMTAAGKIPPAKILVVGAGVAGLAAIQTAKKAGAIVYGFDARSVAKEQVESCGATFLEVKMNEDGAGEGGYAKEMSQAWKDATNKMLLEECKKFDIIITTALVPGMKAPLLITKEMVEAMPFGGVTVDLAAAAGGNIETTVPGKVVKHGSITCVGYTNMESRMANIASEMYGGNISNFLLSMEDKVSKQWKINLEDPAVRSICIVLDGKKLDPYVPPAHLASAGKGSSTAKNTKKIEIQKTDEEIKKEYMKSALFSSIGTTTALGIASFVPNAPMMTTFALSCWVGNNCVKGVTHALHSPLMALTNAISGMTIVGGMLQLGGGLVPTTVPQALAAAAGKFNDVNDYFLYRQMLSNDLLFLYLQIQWGYQR